MLQFIPAAASLFTKAAAVKSFADGAKGLTAGGGSSSGGFLKPTSPKKDPERARRAAEALRRALAGDLGEAQWIYSQMTGSATAYGKQQYQIAWESLKTQNPELAAEAIRGGYRLSQTAVPDARPTSRELIAGELENLKNNVRQDAATTTSRILAGTNARIADEVAGLPAGSYQPFPAISKDKLVYIGLALILAAVALWWFNKR